MATFKDSKNREWRVSFNLGHLTTLRESGIDIGGMQGDLTQLAALLYGDIEKLGRMLWILLEDQATKHQLTPTTFASIFDSETLDQATQALEVAYLGFTQRLPQTREAMLTSYKEMVNQIDSRLSSVLNDTATGSEPSSASTPGPSASAS